MISLQQLSREIVNKMVTKSPTRNLFLITLTLRDLDTILSIEVKVEIDHVLLRLKFFVELLLELF